jgi:hypothetical protein
MDPASIANLLSLLLPTATNFLIAITHPDGTQTVLARLDQVDQANLKNTTDINAFLDSLKPAAGPVQTLAGDKGIASSEVVPKK